MIKGIIIKFALTEPRDEMARRWVIQEEDSDSN